MWLKFKFISISLQDNSFSAMSVHDIFKSVSTIQTPGKKESSSNSHVIKSISANSNTNTLIHNNDLGTITPTNLISFSNSIEHFDACFVKIQNSFEKSRQWKFLRTPLYVPSLTLLNKCNKFDLQRFEKR